MFVRLMPVLHKPGACRAPVALYRADTRLVVLAQMLRNSANHSYLFG